MKVKALRAYKDKITKIRYKAGDEIEVTEERFEEINSTALGIFVEEIAKESEDIQKPDTENQEEDVPKTEKTEEADKPKSSKK